MTSALTGVLSFNPCFNGSDSKSADAGERIAAALEVSILVLMEVTLKASCISVASASALGFNPCFNGSDSKSC